MDATSALADSQNLWSVYAYCVSMRDVLPLWDTRWVIAPAMDSRTMFCAVSRCSIGIYAVNSGRVRASCHHSKVYTERRPTIKLSIDLGISRGRCSDGRIAYGL